MHINKVNANSILFIIYNISEVLLKGIYIGIHMWLILKLCSSCNEFVSPKYKRTWYLRGLKASAYIFWIVHTTLSAVSNWLQLQMQSVAGIFHMHFSNVQMCTETEAKCRRSSDVANRRKMAQRVKCWSQRGWILCVFVCVSVFGTSVWY